VGVSIDSGGGKGRKGVDSEVNLIPFIDLLSVCILFLLMTAVWVQISKMSAFTQPSGEATITHSEVSSVNQAREERDLEILVRADFIEVKTKDRSYANLTFDTLGPRLDSLKAAMAADFQPKISLRAADEVIYEDVIGVLDQLFTRQWTQISVGGI
jgi:biopolymer transport protein ExbD